MSSSSDETFSVEDVQANLDVLRAVDGKVVEAVKGAKNTEVLEYLIREQQLDLHHEGDQGVGKIRRAVLESKKASQDLKRTVITRGDDTPETVLVPKSVERNARTALRTGKPVVLYGPTGTGKTTFAKQLALRHCVGYSLHTATPSWTAKDIIGGIGPNLTGSSGYQSLNYETELGAVSAGVKGS
jgi:5-methylcytosine-specific restriction protein B